MTCSSLYHHVGSCVTLGSRREKHGHHIRWTRDYQCFRLASNLSFTFVRRHFCTCLTLTLDERKHRYAICALGTNKCKSSGYLRPNLTNRLEPRRAHLFMTNIVFVLHISCNKWEYICWSSHDKVPPGLADRLRASGYEHTLELEFRELKQTRF